MAAAACSGETARCASAASSRRPKKSPPPFAASVSLSQLPPSAKRRPRALSQSSTHNASTSHAASSRHNRQHPLSSSAQGRPSSFQVRASADSASTPPNDATFQSKEILESDTEGDAAVAQPALQGDTGNGAPSSSAGAGAPSGMAEAFDITPRTALTITALVTCSAFVLPFALKIATAGASVKIQGLTYLTLMLGFYMAWNIGANDVANAMGTSVGSGALTLRQAVLTAAILEFGGAFLVGSHVSHTMQSGIVNAQMFAGNPDLLFTGMLASLAAAGTWLQVASSYGWPVSTTHCIIGALVGFGLVNGGVEAVYWRSLARVVSSWIISPLFGGSIAYIVYRCIRMFVYDATNPGQAACQAAPVLVFLGVTAFSLSSLLGGGPVLWPVLQSLAAGTVGAVLVSATIDRQLGEYLGDFCEIPGRVVPRRVNPRGPTGTQLRIVYVVFGYLQVLSACFMSFAHGANDVANAIGPILAALSILQGPGAPALADSVATRVLVWGGFGIVAGLLVWGYKVIATIGKGITELTPTRGFAAEFSAATVVVVASRMGLPISATHTLVGAVMGVGLARGLNSVRFDVMKEIATSWIVTIPIGAVLSVLYTFILQRVLPSIAG